MPARPQGRGVRCRARAGGRIWARETATLPVPSPRWACHPRIWASQSNKSLGTEKPLNQARSSIPWEHDSMRDTRLSKTNTPITIVLGVVLKSSFDFVRKF